MVTTQKSARKGLAERMSVRWGIVGLGYMAARIAGAIKLADGALLHAVCSRDAQKAASFAAEHDAAVSV